MSVLINFLLQNTNLVSVLIEKFSQILLVISDRTDNFTNSGELESPLLYLKNEKKIMLMVKELMLQHRQNDSIQYMIPINI
jgi:hypothetical protein